MNQTLQFKYSRRTLLTYCSVLALSHWTFDALGAEKNKVILVVGDSLSAGYGLKPGAGWVALLVQQLARTHLGWSVVNASISGDTSAGGLARLPALLEQHRPSITVLELGANDALRGLSLAALQLHLNQMVQRVKAVHSKVLLLGAGIPANYGQKYVHEFAATFSNVAQQEKVTLSPFLPQEMIDAQGGVAWMQADRLHPNEAAQPLLLANVWPALKPLIEKP
jgi:acyl-CoA thioesterase I